MGELEEHNKGLARERLIISLWRTTKQMWKHIGEIAIAVAGQKTIFAFLAGSLVHGVRNSIGLGYSVLLYTLDRRNYGKCKNCTNPYHCRTGNWQLWDSQGKPLCEKVKKEIRK